MQFGQIKIKIGQAKLQISLQFQSTRLINSKVMQKRQLSLRMRREVQELGYLKVKLNQHLRIVNSTQYSFNSQLPQNRVPLPIVKLQKAKAKSDRYSTEKEKYQNSLRTVLVEIRKKMEETTRGEVKCVKFRSNRRPQSLSPINRQSFDFKIQAVNLSPEPMHRANNLAKSYIQRSSLKKINQRKHRGNLIIQDKFIFQPWYQKEQLQFYTLD